MADLKNSRVPLAVGLCATDERFSDFVNEAEQRMMALGNWVGTQGQHLMRVINGKITWPRHVLAPNAVSLCGCTLDIRDAWFEHISNGPGLQDEACGHHQVIDRGISVAFDDVDAEGLGDKKIRIYCDLSVDVGKTVTLQGTDENGSRVMTLVSGSWIDGEQIILAQSPGTLSTKKYTKLLGAIKEPTSGWVRGYEVDAGTGLNTKPLFVYDPSETLPAYRRSVIAGYGEEDASDVRTVTAWCNLRHIDVRRDPDVNDNDYLVITSIPA